ncbi:guanine deaminase [Tissierella praeacuta DSM 18095]|uniref:Guanine deaminase n=1 Tax=Tissierella praeacuta DSM 18095 TaxID=1123404 RepID=A0A1M4UHN0_9FIRM|nr:guanine deaminase [Tissierella praeacuta]SHE56154.1 guanine deaminase [Tissierella praeacuta DSM 18095]SUP03725.1 Guanine deaminase [Tissierella praeacuta]
MRRMVLKGNVAFTPTKEKFETHENSYIIVENGKIVDICKDLENSYKDYPLKDFSDKIIIPGFVDLHLHAPQYPNRGLGLDKELIPWLETYTFPEEGKYNDLDYSKKIYSRLINELWRVGTTRAVVFSSIHKESTKLLLDMFIESGLGAYIGKVNMDRNTAEYLMENTRTSIVDTEEILKEYMNKSSLVKPIITPRFAPTCSEELLENLGNLAVDYKIPVQSHLSENRSEVTWVKELFPESKNYASVYNYFNLFGQTKTIMAHCIYNTDEEIELMAQNGVYAAHCPYSNYNLSSGIMPVRKFLNKGVSVGLASDISGGNSLRIPNIIAGTIQASKMTWLNTGEELAPLTFSEGFFLGTKGGGSFFGKVGSFEKGYDFDALIIDDSTLSDIDELTIEERLQRFIYIGDDRHIMERYVQGVKIEEP